jgi:hypothetical protein
MATQLHHLTNVILSASVLNELTVGTWASANVAQGWHPGTNAAPNYATYTPASAGPSWNATEPTAFSAKGFRSGYQFNGVYANANWVLNGVVRSHATYYDGTGQVKFRLWRSVNADGSAATQITPGWQASSTIEWTAASQDQAFQITWSPGGTVTLTNEYLFLEIEWSIVGTGGNSNLYVWWVLNNGAAEMLTTPDFTPAAAGGGGLTLPKRYGMAGVA